METTLRNRWSEGVKFRHNSNPLYILRKLLHCIITCEKGEYIVDMVVNRSLKDGVRSSTERFMFRSDTQVLTNKDDRLSQSTLCSTSFILPNYVLVVDFHFTNTNKNLLLRT